MFSTANICGGYFDKVYYEWSDDEKTYKINFNLMLSTKILINLLKY